MRSVDSPIAVSSRIGTRLVSRRLWVSSSPLSPGIMMSTTSMSKVMPASLARASAALTAVVTR
jgi:hypothetical protein